jgi:hypothetical protein
MENTEIMTAASAEMLEKVLVSGDLAKMTAPQRLDYYRQVCRSMGLNPLSRPFDYIELNGKLTLYAKKDATDQLRKINGVSIDDIDIQETQSGFRVKVKGHDRDGRSDVEIGCVAKSDMRGNIQNAEMKAVTKAKRRLTLSLCGLGWLDETEIETIPNAQPVVVDNQGEIINDTPKLEKPAKRPWSDEEFLAKFSKPDNIPDIDSKAAETYTDSNGNAYKGMGLRELYSHWMGLAKRIRTENEAEAELTAMKIGAICRIIQDIKLDRSIKAPNGGRPDPFVPSSN